MLKLTVMAKIDPEFVIFSSTNWPILRGGNSSVQSWAC